MKEYIERAAVHELVKSIPHYQMFNYDRTESRRGISPDDVDFGVDKIPAADVAEVRHGRWIIFEMNFGYCDIIQKEYIAKKYTCSECGYETGEQAKKFVCCPICMARMDKEDEHEAM